jgi:hypothetical protein
MTATFEQARALFGSDEQMARALFDQVAIMRIDLQLQLQLRHRAEEKLQRASLHSKLETEKGRRKP